MQDLTLDTQVARILRRSHPPLVMTIEDVADVLGYSANYVRNELQHQPDFPAKLDRFKQSRWARQDVLAWAGVQSN